MEVIEVRTLIVFVAHPLQIDSKRVVILVRVRLIQASTWPLISASLCTYECSRQQIGSDGDRTPNWFFVRLRSEPPEQT